MSYVFCNQCGHRNPPASNFCSSCGGALDVLDDRTITLISVDPLQDAPGPSDDIAVPVSEIARGTGVLIVRSGGLAGARFSLEGPATRIGRHPDSEIMLDDITVSRRHAEILRRDIWHEILDSGSLNGTYVNHERIEATMLQHGDQVQIGKFHLVYFERSDG